MIGQEKQPVDVTRREPLQINELLVEAIAGAAQDDTISELRGALFDSAGELGIERIGDIWGGDADDVCRALQQTLRVNVRTVVKSTDRALDPLHCPRGQIETLVE